MEIFKWPNNLGQEIPEKIERTNIWGVKNIVIKKTPSKITGREENIHW
jgi:hypothetical protein